MGLNGILWGCNDMVKVSSVCIAQWMAGEWGNVEERVYGGGDLSASWSENVLCKQNKLFIENYIKELKVYVENAWLVCDF